MVNSSVFAAGSWSAGRMRGRTAARVGEFTARKAVCTANTVRIAQGPPIPVIDAPHSISEVTAMPVFVTMSRPRRSTASAIAPPHSPNTMSGTRPNRPVSPT